MRLNSMLPMRSILACAVTLGLGLRVAAPLHAADASDYQHCAQLTQRAPEKALSMAEEWAQKDNHPSAYHCRALALFALKRYPEAAKALERLSFVVTQNNPLLWGSILRQAARSWSLAGDNAKAIVVLTKGINHFATLALNDTAIAQLCADLLLERSTLYGAGGRDLFALQDLDQALSLTPDDPRLLMGRARLFLAQGETALATRDIDRIKQQHPNYPGIQQLTLSP